MSRCDPVKVNPRPTPTSPEKAGKLDKRTRKNEAMSPLPGKYFHFNVLACPRLPVKVYFYLVQNVSNRFGFQFFLAETKGNINQAGCTTTYIGIFYKKKKKKKQACTDSSCGFGGRLAVTVRFLIQQAYPLEIYLFCTILSEVSNK